MKAGRKKKKKEVRKGKESEKGRRIREIKESEGLYTIYQLLGILYQEGALR